MAGTMGKTAVCDQGQSPNGKNHQYPFFWLIDPHYLVPLMDNEALLAHFLPQCYKSSKEHSPQLDISLLGCSVTHKEKQVRKKEHKLKITPTNGDVIVLGMQSRDQALQWLKVTYRLNVMALCYLL